MAGPSGRYRSRGTRDEGTCVKSNLQGKVTGGSSGIGLAAGKMLVEAGAYVFIMGRRQSALGARDRSIRVNTLSPGAIDTPIIDGQF